MKAPTRERREISGRSIVQGVRFRPFIYSPVQSAGSLKEAETFGRCREESARMVFIYAQLGGTRMIDMLVGDPLPRIC